MATYDRLPVPPLSQQMDAEEPVVDAEALAGFDLSPRHRRALFTRAYRVRS